MKRRTRLSWLVGGIATIGLMIGAAGTWHPSDARAMGWHRGGMMGLEGMLHSVDLTSDQKKQLAAILRAHKTELLGAHDRMTQAGRAVMEGLASQETAPEALQGKVDAAAEAGKALGRALIGVRRDVMAILTGQQKQDLVKRQQRFLQRMEKRIGENRQDRERDLDEWIERLSR